MGCFIEGKVKMSDWKIGVETPLVSVIVPTRNSASTMDTCLASIVAQSYKNIELIVVDNNSTDETKKIARGYTNLVFNKGPERNVQRAFAAGEARGKYVVFIDSDMELPPSLIEAALNKCEKDKFDAIILPEISVGEGFWANCRKLEKLCYLNDSYMELANRFIKLDVYNAVGGYDCNKDWIGAEDFDIHERIKNSGYNIGRIDELIKHHEIVPFGKMLQKYYVYSKCVPKHIRKHPKSGLKQFWIIRPAYIRNWHLFVKDPIHGVGLAFMKSAQYFVGGLGFLVSLFQKQEAQQCDQG